MPLLETALIILIWGVHAWMLLGHKSLLRTKSGDRPKDAYFTQTRLVLLFALALGAHGLGAYRGLLIAWGKWDGSSWWEQVVGLWPLPHSPFIVWSGIMIFALGVWLRLWAVKTLGDLFTFEIGIRQNHRPIQKGPYRLIRHPGYSGYILMVVGICLQLTTLLGLVLALLGVGLVFGLRIPNEEKMLEEEFGQEYRDYSRRTWRLFPWIF